MKKIILTPLIAMLLSFGLTLNMSAQDLMITGVADGDLTGGLPKAIELYVVNDIADLSTYGLGSANNGDGTDGEEFTFPADAATAGDFIYVASESTEFTNFFGFAPDYTDAMASINGDDAVELFNAGAVIDVFGEITYASIGTWEYSDGWAYRVDGATASTTFTEADWTISNSALAGETDNASATDPFPIGTFTMGGGGLTLPFYETYETWPLENWTITGVGAEVWESDDGSTHGPGSVTEGSLAAMFDVYNASSGNTTTMTTDIIDMDGAVNPNLSFDFWMDGYSADADLWLKVEMTTDGTTWNEIFYHEYDGNAGWSSESIALTGVNATTQIRIIGASDYGSYNLFVDNLAIVDITCPDPTDLALDGSTATDATISWTENGSASSWNVIYGAPGFDPTTEGTTEVASAIPFTIPGLSASTSYDVYVQADCGSGDLSTMAGPLSVTTVCDAIATFPWTENFDGNWTTWCWTVIDDDGDGTTWTQDDTYITPHSGAWTAHGMDNADDYLITPEISVNTANLLIEWYDVVENSTYNNTYDVLVSTTDTDLASFTDTLGTYDCTNETWTAHTLDLSTDYDGQNIYIAFHQTYSAAGTYLSYGFGIDDVTLREINSETDILSYIFPEQTGPATIDDGNYEIEIEVDFTADLTNLVADFTLSTGATATVGGSPQTSGVTENDFTDTVTYTVTAEDGSATQDWDVIVTQEASPLGATCDNPYLVELPADITYEHLTQTTCGLGNVFDDTDMYSYDNGEDAIYEITITEDVVVDITLDAHGTTYTGMGLFSSCPGNDELIDDISNSGSDPTVVEGMVLSPGTYYLMIDSYEYYTECIPEYDLTIESSCLPPADVEATILTPTSADVTWTPMSMGDSWQLKVDTISIDPTADPGNIFNSEVTPDPEQSLTGLEPDSTYYVYVQDNCGSGWSTEYTFTMPSACPQPTDLFASAIATDYAELDWNAYGATEWNIQVDTVPIVPETDTGNIVNETTTEKPYQLSGLDANTTYYFYVQSSCGTDTSEWSAEGEFTTECDVVSTFPMTEDFDGDWTTWCWTVIDNDGDGTTWTQDDTYITPHSGDWTAHGMGNEDDYLITPELVIGNNFAVKWWDVVEDVDYNNTYDVLVSTTDTDPASFTDNLGTFDCTNETWTEHTLDLSAYAGQNIYIAFHQTYSEASYYGFGIDDVTVVEIPLTDLELIEPASGYACDLTDTQEVPVQFDNVGNTTIATGETVNFTLDTAGTNVIDEDFTLSADLLPGESFTGFTTTTLDLSAIGTYEFEAALTYASDENAANDTIEGYIVHFEQEIEFVDAVNDTITIPAADYPYTIEANVVHTPDSTTLTAAYLWGDGSTDPSLSVNEDGWYVLEVTTEECTVEDSVYVDSYSGIEDDNTADLAVYPNPSQGKFMVDMTLVEKQNVVLTIISSNGQVVRNYKFDDVETIRESIDLNGMAEGLYNLRINAGDKYYTRQIIVR